MQSSDFKKLVVWQKAMALVSKIYKEIRCFPEDEKYGLCSQMRRCAVSIPSNIAEGQARCSKKEFIHFLHIARGSGAELETQLLISRDLGLITSELCETLSKDIHEIGRLIISLVNYLDKPLKPKN